MAIAIIYFLPLCCLSRSLTPPVCWSIFLSTFGVVKWCMVHGVFGVWITEEMGWGWDVPVPINHSYECSHSISCTMSSSHSHLPPPPYSHSPPHFCIRPRSHLRRSQTSSPLYSLLFLCWPSLICQSSEISLNIYLLGPC